MYRPTLSWIACAALAAALIGSPLSVYAADPDEETVEQPAQDTPADQPAAETDSPAQTPVLSPIDSGLSPLTEPKTDEDIVRDFTIAAMVNAAPADNPMSEDRIKQLQEGMVMDSESPLAKVFMEQLAAAVRRGEDVEAQIVNGQVMGVCSNTQELCWGNSMVSPEDSTSATEIGGDPEPEVTVADNKDGKTVQEGDPGFVGPPCPESICGNKETPESPETTEIATNKEVEKAADSGDTGDLVQALDQQFNNPDNNNDAGTPTAYSENPMGGNTAMRNTPATMAAQNADKNGGYDGGTDMTAKVFNANPEAFAEKLAAVNRAMNEPFNFSAPTGPTVAQLDGVLKKGTMSYVDRLLQRFLTPQPDDGMAAVGHEGYGGARSDRPEIQVADNNCKGLNNTLRTGAQNCS